MSSILELLNDNDDSDNKCLHVNSLNDTFAKCNFTMNTKDCAYDGIVYDFTHLVYCDIGDQYRAASICILFAIILFLFLNMGIVADEFLCPSLLTISKTLRLPDNIAGVTFLALGNGAPDIFSSISGVSQAKPQLIFSGLYGAGIFVTTIVVGSVLLTGEFEVMQRPLMRDIGFYIGAAFMVWFIIWRTRIYLKNAIALVCVYIGYIIVVIIARYFFMRTVKGRNGKADDKTDDHSSNGSTDISIISDGNDKTPDPEGFGNTVDFMRTKNKVTKRQRSKSLAPETDIVLTRFYKNGMLQTPRHSRTNSMIKHHLAHHHHDNMLAVISRNYDNEYDEVHNIRRNSRSHSFHNNNNNINNTNIQKPEEQFTIETPIKPKKVNFFRQISNLSAASIFSAENFEASLTESKEFLIHISPVDYLEWPEYPWYKKAMEIVKAIPYFFMTLCIPVVDLESHKNNWCRLLTCINLILAPQVAIFFLSYSDVTIGDTFPIWALVLIISCMASIIVYLTSNPKEPPVYNNLFSFLGFLVSVLFINAIADEVINVLETLGVMFSMSDSILGLTILAWGNSLGDLISDLSMARHGHPGIGISACFGGPLLNLLLGLGLPYTILLVDKPEEGIELEYTQMVTLLYTTLTTSLVSSFVLFIFNRFKSTKIHGIYLICIYLVYFVLAFLIEYKIV